MVGSSNDVKSKFNEVRGLIAAYIIFQIAWSIFSSHPIEELMVIIEDINKDQTFDKFEQQVISLFLLALVIFEYWVLYSLWKIKNWARYVFSALVVIGIFLTAIDLIPFPRSLWDAVSSRPWEAGAILICILIVQSCFQKGSEFDLRYNQSHLIRSSIEEAMTSRGDSIGDKLTALERLQMLREKGAITEEQFEAQKSNLFKSD